MEKRFTPKELDEFNKMKVEYRDIPSFIENNQKINYISFDYAVVNELNLFNLQPDFDFELVEEITKRAIKALPAIKKIFAKPIIHLRESAEILPVESVRLINSDTMTHIATHSELWDDIKDDMIMPTKLLTNSYKDNYGLYENIVFCNMIDMLMSYTRNSLRFLKSLIYTNQSIELNLLERLNHMNYFLALGKLHTGYLRNYSSLYSVSNKTFNELETIYSSIATRLKRPVYRLNRKRNTRLRLHKSNVFEKHKDYHQIYLLMQFLLVHKVDQSPDLNDEQFHEIARNYFYFCEILAIFSIGHFNFVSKDTELIDFDNLNVNFSFKKWKLNIASFEVNSVKVLKLEAQKNQTYSIALVPKIIRSDDEEIAKIKDALNVDECIIASPYHVNLLDTVYLSISNVESFRRIEQLLLRAMIKADTDRVDCPFCVKTLKKVVDKPEEGLFKYQCETCRTEIVDAICPDTNEPYTFTTILGQKKELRENTYIKEDQWLYLLRLDSLMHFRNITKIDPNMEIICPSCGKIHPVNFKKTARKKST